mgnify:CR=1 FL=1
MMAQHLGGRPGSSRRVRMVPVRQSSMDHRAVARIVLALARQMAAEADEAVEPAVDEAVSPGTGVCARSERVASVGRCAANEPVSASAGSGLAGRCSHQRHEGAHYSAHGTSSAGSHALPDRAGAAESDEAAASSTPGGTP